MKARLEHCFPKLSDIILGITGTKFYYYILTVLLIGKYNQYTYKLFLNKASKNISEKIFRFFQKNLFLKNLKTTYENSMNVVWEWMKSEKHRVVVITMVPPNSSITWFYEKELGEKKGNKGGRDRGKEEEF